MLEIHCPEKIREEIAFSRQEGSLDSLKQKLRYLSHYGEGSYGAVIAHIWPDPYGHTLGFNVVQADTGLQIGGMIGGLHYDSNMKRWGTHT